MPGAHGLVKFELGGELCIYFYLGKNPLIVATTVALSARGGSCEFIFTSVKIRGTYQKNNNNQMGSWRHHWTIGSGFMVVAMAVAWWWW